ncbi:hypothetical protein NB063_29230 [Rhodopirellula sp. ICT_H3.1]|uniref:Uncharacterized protein n=2 Tax=Aporhodopirellula aestuarii TaxID=2950107 RepID=A0ABT0UES2_9BACT|nr:hypothetical protein [Aporhodopirellula aestuarii]
MSTHVRLGCISLCLALFPISVTSGSDSEWDYTHHGSMGISEAHAGRAGKFRTYECTTTDSPEKVVLWYAKRLGLPSDHSLVTTAEKGFSNLESQRLIKNAYGHDTDDRKDHTTMVAFLAAKHVHITFLHRPSFDGKKDVTISIAKVPDGRTSIAVIQPVVGQFRSSDSDPE